MATYFGTSINDSATVIYPAASALTGIQGTALALGAGGVLSKPEAGANVLGLSLFTNDDSVDEGDDVTVQVKEMGKWIVAEAVKAGDELTTNADGKAVKAKSKDFIVAIALNDCDTAGDVAQVQLIKAGYKA